MSIGGFWRRYLETGEYLATCEPELFPSVVALLEALAHPDETGESELRGFLRQALGCVLPRAVAGAALSASQITDVLVLADPSLVDVPYLDSKVATFSDDERSMAMSWAREHVAAMLDQIESRPAVPLCVGRLYAHALARVQSDQAV